MNKPKSYCIHASNIAGLGSITVVSNLLSSLSKFDHFSNTNVILLLPKIPFWESTIHNYNNKWDIRFIRRSKYKFIRLVDRVIDILFGHNRIPNVDVLLVLGDFPLKFKKDQIVLFHNVNIINKEFNVEFIFHKLFFKLNFNYINKLVVQTDIVKHNLLLTYPKLSGKINVLPMPVDELYNIKHTNYIAQNSYIFKLFYPSSYYKHKNHKVIIDLCKQNIISSDKLEFIFTIPHKFNNIFDKISDTLIKNIGPLTNEEVFDNYKNVNALIFPSLNESYGLPLIEAMKMNLFIICADLPYAKWICGNQAKYFNPNDTNSLYTAIKEVLDDNLNNIKPNWNEPLSKIPENWDNYAMKFLN